MKKTHKFLARNLSQQGQLSIICSPGGNASNGKNVPASTANISFKRPLKIERIALVKISIYF